MIFTNLLSVHSASLKDFWAISLVCKASSKASKLVKYVIADVFTVKENTWDGGFQSYLNNTRMLLHGPQMNYHIDGPKLTIFSFGKII